MENRPSTSSLTSDFTSRVNQLRWFKQVSAAVALIASSVFIATFGTRSCTKPLQKKRIQYMHILFIYLFFPETRLWLRVCAYTYNLRRVDPPETQPARNTAAASLAPPIDHGPGAIGRFPGICTFAAEWTFARTGRIGCQTTRRFRYESGPRINAPPITESAP